jgi:hypothetical protein
MSVTTLCTSSNKILSGRVYIIRLLFINCNVCVCVFVYAYSISTFKTLSAYLH